MWKDMLSRFSFWASTCQVFGSCLVAIGFQIQVIEGAKVGDVTGLYPQIALKAQYLWALYLGWGLIILGFVMHVISEYQTSRALTKGLSVQG